MDLSERFRSLIARFRGPQNRLTNFVSRLTKFVSRLTSLKVCSRSSFWDGMKLRTGSRGGTKTTYKPKSMPEELILESLWGHLGLPWGALLAYLSAFGIDFCLNAQSCERLRKTKVSRFLAFYPLILACQAFSCIPSGRSRRDLSIDMKNS